MEIIFALMGLYFNLLLLPMLVVGFSILLIKQLSDDPKNPDKPYFFTAIEPGRIKAVLRGGKVRRYLMNYSGHRFEWDRTRIEEDVEKDSSWDVTRDQPSDTPLEDKYEKFDFLKYLTWFLPSNFWSVSSWCLGIIFKATGHKFVGIWPFQTLHLYTFTRKVQKMENGKPLTNAEGMPILEDSLETTDHVRARVFVWNVEGQAGETKEGLKILVRGLANVCTTNPQKALFGTDKWDVALTSTILRSLASNIRTMSIDEILTYNNTNTKNKDQLATTIKTEANKTLKRFGLEITDYKIVDFEAQLSPEDAAALTAKWRAERNKDAERIAGEGRGEGRAAEIIRVAEAVNNGGEAAKRAQELEALIRQAAEASKSGGVVILGGQAGSDGTNAAILAELKKLNRDRGRK
jgi:regulator of protease activity HflC (stomatin/prohibitin superfamily)